MSSWISFIVLILVNTIVQCPSQQIVERYRDTTLNDRPIIGILSQELSMSIGENYPQNHTSYIAASYVKFLEGAGARVVPILIKQNEEYYTNLLDSINGVLLPGGAVWFNNTDGYATAGEIIMNYAEQLNLRGEYFPVWGTCLGYELMAFIAAKPDEPRTRCYSYNVTLPLNLKPDYFNSRLFSSVPKEIVNILTSRNVTSNFHTYCITEERFEELGMDKNWKVLSTNVDEDGIEFISSLESRTFPFYGVQFHPEKNGYEFKANKDIPHSLEAVFIMQYFADFFVLEARKSEHQFTDPATEHAALIYNHLPTYTGDRLSFEQLYFFDY